MVCSFEAKLSPFPEQRTVDHRRDRLDDPIFVLRRAGKDCFDFCEVGLLRLRPVRTGQQLRDEASYKAVSIHVGQQLLPVLDDIFVLGSVREFCAGINGDRRDACPLALPLRAGV